MASVALGARLEHSVLIPQTPRTQIVAVPPAAPVVIFADPVQEATWVDGQRSLGLMLGRTSYTAFMSTGSGKVVSLCGTVKGTSGYQTGDGQQRYISVFGRPDGTLLETDDPSFGVLWDRVCRGSSGGA